MATIKKVIKRTWTLKTGKTEYVYRVHYKNEKEPYKGDRIVRYTDNQKLPLTIVEYVLNAEKVDTYYCKESEIDWRLLSAKKETFYN